MDDREEGTRRHLEEIAPDIETYGAAGFLGIAMYWQGIDDAAPSALCPVVVKPRHLVRERAAPGADAALARHAARRERRLRWRERLYQRRAATPVGGTLLGALAGLPALAALGAALLAPGAFGRTLRRWRQASDGRVATTAAVCAETAEGDGGAVGEVQPGFTDVEQVDRVEALLRTIGLVDGFARWCCCSARFEQRQQPHRSAYDWAPPPGRHAARTPGSARRWPSAKCTPGWQRGGIAIPDDTWLSPPSTTPARFRRMVRPGGGCGGLPPALDRLVAWSPSLQGACRRTLRGFASAPALPTRGGRCAFWPDGCDISRRGRNSAMRPTRRPSSAGAR
jgi:uncharacterized protein YbcC (UPF0753/DUF2309 family)